jgi:hypothetical protein
VLADRRLNTGGAGPAAREVAFLGPAHEYAQVVRAGWIRYQSVAHDRVVTPQIDGTAAEVTVEALRVVVDAEQDQDLFERRRRQARVLGRVVIAALDHVGEGRAGNERSSCRFRRAKKPSTIHLNHGTRTGHGSRSKSTWRAASSRWRLANSGPLSMATARGSPSHSQVPRRPGKRAFSACFGRMPNSRHSIVER